MELINDKLLEVYKENWSEYSSRLKNVLSNDTLELKPTNPLLIQIDEEKYQDADIKVMIFGQETNNWDGDFSGDIGHSLEMYDEFFNYDKGKGYGGQFWNGFHRFLSILEEKYPNKTIDSIWNNTIKTGVSGRGMNNPPEYIYEVEKSYFNIIKKEIEILKPDIILFLSGPNYDIEIVNSLGKIEFVSISPDYCGRQISKITSDVNQNIFRTYHPGFLWRNDINSYFKTIINNINL